MAWRGLVRGCACRLRAPALIDQYGSFAAAWRDYVLGADTRYATPSVAEIATGGRNTSTSTFTFDASDAAEVGAVVIAAVYINAVDSEVTSFSDDAGNTWTLQHQAASNAAQLFVWSTTVTSAIAAGDTFTVAMPFSQSRFAAQVLRVRGVASATPLAEVSATSTTATPSASNATPTDSDTVGRLVVGLHGVQSGAADVTFTAPPASTLPSQGGSSSAGSSNRQVAATWFAQESIGQAGASVAISASSNQVTAVLVFELVERVDATVSAVAGAVTLAAQAPTATGGTGGGGGATVTLPSAAATTLAAHAPTVTGDALVNAAAAAVTLAAPAPTVTGDATVTGEAAAVTLAALAPSVTGDAIVTGVASTLSLAAHAPTVSGAGSGAAQVDPPAAAVSLVAHAPTVTASSTVSAAAATITLAALAPTVAAGATIAAERGTITLSAPAPVVTGTSGSATVNAEPALIVIAAIVPDVYGDTPSPVYFPTVGPTPLAVDADDDEALLLTLLLT